MRKYVSLWKAKGKTQQSSGIKSFCVSWHFCVRKLLKCSPFSSIFLCEQLFPLMKINKASHRSRLTDEHLHSILGISSVQSLTPDIDGLASKKRWQVSGLDQCTSECSKLSLNFELSFLYAPFSCYCKAWTVNSCIVVFSLKEIIFGVVLLLACEKKVYTENKLETERGTRIYFILFYLFK